MQITLLGVSHGTRHIEDTIETLIEKGVPLQSISLVLPESTDIPNNYFQRLDLIDTVAGDRIGINPIAIFDVTDVLLFGGPLADMLGADTAVDTEDADDSVTGPLAGGLLNSLMDIGVQEEDAKRIRESLNEGDILFGVSIDDSKEDETRQVLNENELEGVQKISR